MRWHHGLAVVTGVLLCTTVGRGADDFKDLLSRVPSSANALVIVDIQGLIKSQRGMREGWSRKHQSEYLEGAVMVPPSVDKVVFASELGGHGGGWVVGVMPSQRQLDMQQLAKNEKSEVEMVSGVASVQSRRDAYFVELGPKLLGVMSPANRQEVSRWLRTAKKGGDSNLSGYLNDAVAFPRNGQVLIAIDMEDMFHPRAVRNWLQNCKKLGGNEADIAKAHQLIGSLRGVKFMARVTDKIQAQLYLDFADKIELKDAMVLKPVIQEGLVELGASLDEITGGKANAEGRSVVIEAEISDHVLRRLMSIIQVPAPHHGDVTESGPTPTEDPALYASKRYFAAVQSHLNELRDLNRRAFHSGMQIQWFETYARKIDQLPLVNVDEELLQYGRSVSDKLRMLAASQRGENINVNRLDSYKRTNITAWGPSWQGGGWGGWGYGGGWGSYQSGGFWRESNAADIATAKADSVARTRNERGSIWQSIDQDTADVRRAMAQKFMVDFGV